MEAFVYEWVNQINGKKYVGYHKGTEDDGYVCSSKSELFWEDYKKGILKRNIIFKGSMSECITKESNILRRTGLKNLYNNNINGKIFMTEEVRQKMSKAGKGKKQNETHLKNRTAALKGRIGGFVGKVHSDETKEKQRLSALKRKRKVCPHCGKECSVNTYSRWHGDKCKEK